VPSRAHAGLSTASADSDLQIATTRPWHSKRGRELYSARAHGSRLTSPRCLRRLPRESELAERRRELAKAAGQRCRSVIHPSYYAPAAPPRACRSAAPRFGARDRHRRRASGSRATNPGAGGAHRRPRACIRGTRIRSTARPSVARVSSRRSTGTCSPPRQHERWESMRANTGSRNTADGST
jgi:hypothetical protein